MNRHTPAPWELKDFGGPQISGPDGYAIATIWGGRCIVDLPSPDYANAQLITAAPELLGALREAESFIAGFEGDELQEGIDALLTRIRSALNKAVTP